MSEIHVLTTEGGRVRFVLHIPIPDAPNGVGTNWRLAITRSKEGGTTILPDGDGTGGTISAAEKADVVAGILYEASIYKGLPGNWGAMNAAQRNQWLDSLYNVNRQAIVDILQARLDKFGHIREVP